MKSGLYIGKNAVAVTDIPMPEIGPDDVLLETICTGISRADLDAYTKGDTSLIQSGREFGHESFGCVLGLGDDVYDFNLGERVYPLSRYASETPDQACMLGGFSEYMLVRNARRNLSLYPLPDEISDRMGAMLEPFACGCHLARRGMKQRSAAELYYIIKEDAPCRGDIRYEEGGRALVYGGDTCAFAAALMLRWYGMEEVVLCQPSAYRSNLAKKFGLLTLAELPAELSSFDCVIDTMGDPSLASLYAASGRPGSRLVVNADPLMRMSTRDMTAARKGLEALDPLLLAAEDKELLGAASFTPDDIEDVVGMMAGGYFDIESLISHVFSPDQLELALQTAADAENALQVLIEF